MNKVMYLGPARPFELPINTRAVLAGKPEEIFPDLAPRFAEYPTFHKLFVPINEVPLAKAQLAREGTTLAVIYKTVKTASDAWRKARS